MKSWQGQLNTGKILPVISKSSFLSSGSPMGILAISQLTLKWCALLSRQQEILLTRINDSIALGYFNLNGVFT